MITFHGAIALRKGSRTLSFLFHPTLWVDQPIYDRRSRAISILLPRNLLYDGLLQGQTMSMMLGNESPD